MPYPWANSLTVPSTLRNGPRNGPSIRASAAQYGRGVAGRGALVEEIPRCGRCRQCSALGAGRAGAALALGEPGHDQRGRGGRGGRVGAVPACADVALRAGDLPAVKVDVEVVPGEALAPAVLTDGVALERPGDGDLVLTAGLFQVRQRGIAGVDQVLGGQQAAAGEPPGGAALSPPRRPRRTRSTPTGRTAWWSRCGSRGAMPPRTRRFPSSPRCPPGVTARPARPARGRRTHGDAPGRHPPARPSSPTVFRCRLTR
jgi:hypothetical protein